MTEPIESIKNKLNVNYMTRIKQVQNQPYIVVPVVMMVEGVHNGSHGPLLHTARDLEKTVPHWDNIPVTVDHPKKKGEFVSAFDSEVSQMYVVGYVKNVRMESGKLKGEAWLEQQKLIALSPQAMDYIQAGKPLDVSIGVFSDTEPKDGIWNSETYVGIAKNHIPDHLALLPDQQGACSWNDGCGVRVNIDSKKPLKVKANEMKHNDEENKDRIALFQSVLQPNDQIQQIRDDVVIYQREQKELYQQPYSMEEDTVTLEGDPVRVIPTYTVDDPEELKRTKPITNSKKGGNMSDQKTPCFLAKVEKLIAHELTTFEEKDKEWLMEQDEETLGKILPKDVPQAEPPAPAPQINAEQAIQVLKDTLKKPEDFINLVPTEMQDQLKSGLRLHQAHREDLVKTILANAEKDVWTEDELKAMDTAMLEKLRNSFRRPVDYSAQGGGNGVSSSKEELLLPPGVTIDKK